MTKQVLTNEEMNNLLQYKHKAGKTTFELWLCGGFSLWMDKNSYPDSWTPNCVTVIGQIP